METVYLPRRWTNKCGSVCWALAQFPPMLVTQGPQVSSVPPFFFQMQKSWVFYSFNISEGRNGWVKTFEEAFLSRFLGQELLIIVIKKMYGVFLWAPLCSQYFTRISSFIPPPDLWSRNYCHPYFTNERNTLIPREQAHLSTPAALFVKEWLWTSHDLK